MEEQSSKVWAELLATFTHETPIQATGTALAALKRSSSAPPTRKIAGNNKRSPPATLTVSGLVGYARALWLRWLTQQAELASSPYTMLVITEDEAKSKALYQDIKQLNHYLSGNTGAGTNDARKRAYSSKATSRLSQYSQYLPTCWTWYPKQEHEHAHAANFLQGEQRRCQSERRRAQIMLTHPAHSQAVELLRASDPTKQSKPQHHHAPSVMITSAAAVDQLLGTMPASVDKTSPTHTSKLKTAAAELAEQDYIFVKSGASYQRQQLLACLLAWGYQRVTYVNEIGEVALRGDVLEVFSPHGEQAVRLYFFGDELETIQVLAENTQQRFPPLLAKTENKAHVPANESKEKSSKPKRKLSACIVFRYNTSDDTLKETTAQVSQQTLAADVTMDFVKTASLQLGASSSSVPPVLTIKFAQVATTGAEHVHFLTLAARQFRKNLAEMEHALKALLVAGKQVYIFTANPLLIKALTNLLATQPVHVMVREDILRQAAKDSSVASLSTATKDKAKGKIYIVGADISMGFSGTQVEVWTGEDIFGKQRSRASESHVTPPHNFWETFLKLEEDDYVVHRHHGIGYYRGIERLKLHDREKDYFKIEYRDKAKIFIPVEQLHLIQKYVGDRKQVRVDELGKSHWRRTTARAQQTAERVAKKLLALYSKRQLLQVSPLPKEEYFQELFELEFPYEESPDQLTCAAEIKADLERSAPMDRLLCADVGYGKTEVALRAIFKVAMSGRQCLFLAPTTLLSLQHYETFKLRFKTTPIMCGLLNRFTSAKEEKKIIAALRSGKVEVLICTHKGLSKAIKFHKLALLVIDEEQKFGVKQKEALRERYPAVHVLSLSATPIPRTLHLSLSALRDLSFITTPIAGRFPVKTQVLAFAEEVVQAAVAVEIKRQGQCYFIYNHVQTLGHFRQKLQAILPDVSIITIHAQMDKGVIEERFHHFRSGKYQVLLSTSIVDAGLDLPRVNTLFVYHAQRMGLAQLYQLKGRVGRSKAQGYAYFFYPAEAVLTPGAEDRLECLARYTALGSGYQIAIKDLELRGAGNLLGLEQSGTLTLIGLELFSNLLQEAIATLKYGKAAVPTYYEPLIEFSCKAYIPDSYAPTHASKAALYRRIMLAKHVKELKLLAEQLTEEYGKIPVVMEALFALSTIKILAKRLRVRVLYERDDVVEITLLPTAPIDHVNLKKWLLSGRIKLSTEANKVQSTLPRNSKQASKVSFSPKKAGEGTAAAEKLPASAMPPPAPDVKLVYNLQPLRKEEQPLLLEEKLAYTRELFKALTLRQTRAS